MMINEEIIGRFWSKVQKTDDCWRWDACKCGGYGHLLYHRRMFKAHRLSWEIHFGPIPNGLCVCHKCDNRACTRPDHLFLATKAENTWDAMEKGRMGKPTGGYLKLTRSDVLAVQLMRDTGASLRYIGKVFGVSTTAISNYIRIRI